MSLIYRKPLTNSKDINLPLGGIAAVCIVMFLDLPAKGKGTGFLDLLKSLDIPGTIIFIPTVVCLLLALQWGGTKYPWSSGRIIALLVLFAVFTVIFAVIQVFQGEKATIPLRLIKDRNVWGSMWFGFCLGASFFTFVYYVSLIITFSDRRVHARTMD